MGDCFATRAMTRTRISCDPLSFRQEAPTVIHRGKLGPWHEEASAAGADSDAIAPVPPIVCGLFRALRQIHATVEGKADAPGELLPEARARHERTL